MDDRPVGRRVKGQKQGEAAVVRTLVCLTCGAEQFFENAAEVPAGLTCAKCGSTVFREFDTSTRPDEAQIEQLEETRRSVAWGDASPQTTRDDLRDLEHG